MKMKLSEAVLLLLLHLRYTFEGVAEIRMGGSDEATDEGDFCKAEQQKMYMVSTTQVHYGRCTKLVDCWMEHTYFKILKNRYTPWKLCGYNGTMPLVCCPEDAFLGYHASHEEQVFELARERKKQHDEKQAQISRRSCSRYFNTACPVRRMFRSVVNGPDDLKDIESFVYEIYRSFGFNQLYGVYLATDRLAVINGYPALSKEFQPVAAIGFLTSDNKTVYQCGGTLISDQFVLTAAHCTFNFEWGPAKVVRLGELDFATSEDDANPVDYNIVSRIRHPKYKRTSRYHDIALLKLETAVNFSDWVKPACLSNEDFYGKHLDNLTLVAVGWGKTKSLETEDVSSHLLKIELNKVEHEKCKSMYGNSSMLTNGIVEDWQFCAGEPGKDTCSGDSGGPILVKLYEHSCLWDIVGVTNFGNVCGGPIPGVYLRIKNYISWIESIVWKDAK